MQQLIARNANTKIVLASYMLSYNTITNYLSVSPPAFDKAATRNCACSCKAFGKLVIIMRGLPVLPISGSVFKM
jgi:hypothetical protein